MICLIRDAYVSSFEELIGNYYEVEFYEDEHELAKEIENYATGEIRDDDVVVKNGKLYKALNAGIRLIPIGN